MELASRNEETIALMCGMYVSYASNETTDGPDNASLLFCRHIPGGEGVPTHHLPFVIRTPRSRGGCRPAMSAQPVQGPVAGRAPDVWRGARLCRGRHGVSGPLGLWTSGPLGVSAALQNDAWDAYRGAEIEIEVVMVMEIEVEMVIEMVKVMEMEMVKVKVGRGT